MTFQQLYENINTPQLIPLENCKWDEIVQTILDVFPQYSEWVIDYVKEVMNPKISVAVTVGDKIVGVYILGDRSVIDGVKDEEMQAKEDLTPYESKVGVEGVALGVIKRYRDQGSGSLLKTYPQSLGRDYVWGVQLKALNNMQYWLRSRRIVAENHESFISLQDFS